MSSKLGIGGLMLAALALCAASASATTKGLNQIVTPDVQPYGLLSVSLQRQDPSIANRYEVQLEMGVARGAELAIYQGASPSEQVLNGELSVYRKGPNLLSVGFSNWASTGTAPQPYAIAGYYPKNFEYMIGVTRVITETPGESGAVLARHETQAILGAAYQAAPRVLVQLDYQSGASNSTTAGFTYAVTPQLQFNPALYLENASPHHVWGYAVLTWNIQAFR